MLQNIAMISTIAGTAMSAYGMYQMGKYNEQVAENNAQTAEYQAEDALERGEEATRQKQRDIARLKGQQRASIASSGLVVDEDTGADVLTDTELLGQEDILAIRSNAQREAWAYRTQAQNFRAEGVLASAEGTYGATASLLTGAGSVADKWYRYQKGG
jgi:hypothetical protein